MISVVRSERVHRPAHGSTQWSRIWDWLAKRRHRAIAIERLPDHLLRDIGVRRRHQFRRDQPFR
ncbi:MAG TPA: hypothetical protein VGF43_02555 [Dongiaceae bacterium]